MAKVYTMDELERARKKRMFGSGFRTKRIRRKFGAIHIKNKLLLMAR